MFYQLIYLQIYKLQKPTFDDDENFKLQKNGTGLWIMASYVNHSCLSGFNGNFSFNKS
jgi:hypothetical protein